MGLSEVPPVDPWVRVLAETDAGNSTNLVPVVDKPVTVAELHTVPVVAVNVILPVLPKAKVLVFELLLENKPVDSSKLFKSSVPFVKVNVLPILTVSLSSSCVVPVLVFVMLGN
jgi:hypothetical protein